MFRAGPAGTKAGLPGTKAVPWHQGLPSITMIRPQKALQLETLFGGLGGTPSRRMQTLTSDSDFKFARASDFVTL